jgi:hypothetical protein
MRKFVIAAVAAGFSGVAAPAFAGPGQCYDAFGRPVGPVYDTDYPNYAFINAVIRRGGTCTGVVSPPSPPRGIYRYQPYPGYPYGVNPYYPYGPYYNPYSGPGIYIR